MRLKNKIAIITGGAKGIGKATAQLFAKEGATVIIWDLLELGAKVSEDINSSGGSAYFQQVQVDDHHQVSKAVEELVIRYDRIDILINNAGITKDRSILKMSHDEWSQVIDVNLKGVFNCVKAVGPIMKAQIYGRIVSAASIVGLRGAFGQTNYAAAKAGIIAMTKTWALELAKYDITVNSIAPGYIQTEMTEAIPEDIKSKLVANIPAQRVGSPLEVAQAYLFLASNEAAYINGICLSIDGGLAR